MVPGGDSPYEYHFGCWHLKTTLSEKTGNIKITKSGVPAGLITKQTIFPNIFEKKWHRIKQKIVNEIYSSEEGISITLPTVQRQHNFLQKMRGSEIPLAVKTMPFVFVMGPLIKELCKILPEPIALSPELPKESKKTFDLHAEDLLKWFMDFGVPENVAPDSSSPGSPEENSGNHVLDSSNEKTNESSENVEKFEYSANDDQDQTKNQSETLRSKEILEILKDEKEDSKQKNVDEAGDSMEEFKKPVWAPDDGKDEKFLGFQGKSDFPNNFEYTKKYSGNTKNDVTESKRDGKRIEDDL